MLKRKGCVMILLSIYFGYSNGISGQSKNWTAKIVGGSPVNIEKFPSMIQLYNRGDMCAGNILNGWTILTAAHCFDFNKNVAELVIQAGALYVYDFNAEAYGVHSISIHEKYNESQNFACDIALVFLDRHLKFSATAMKALIVNNKNWMKMTETNFTVTGWGWTSYGGEISDQGLMMTRLRFMSNEECARMHQVTFSDDMFCLYGEGNRDTCKGDSGGGVLWHDMIVGITSHGDGCARKFKPSVYANVYYFREWIKQKIQNFIEIYCSERDENYLRMHIDEELT